LSIYEWQRRLPVDPLDQDSQPDSKARRKQCGLCIVADVHPIRHDASIVSPDLVLWAPSRDLPVSWQASAIGATAIAAAFK
jgi:hypothetical protein